MNGKSDPYVILQSGGKKDLKSRTIMKTLDPVWNEELSFTGKLQDFLNTGLLLKVFDYDSPLKMSKDDPLGDLSVSLDFLKHSAIPNLSFLVHRTSSSLNSLNRSELQTSVF